MLTRGDLHIHSAASDGSLRPWEIIQAARNRGIDTIALADHNSTGGIAEAASAGNQYGVAVIPAVELSTGYRGESIHILGYFKNNMFYNSNFQQALRFVRAHRYSELRRLLSSLIYTDKYSGNLSVTEGIRLIRTFGGAAVLAHPVRISSRNLQEMLNMPFDGIEAKYCHNSYYDNNFFINTALSRFSFYTAGSDFHTDSSAHGTHCSIGDPYLDASELAMFLSNSGAAVL